jgi:2-desacetyl-2-hydroxyethyl bacteriochlorophyllide A dehydrogenase
MSQLPATMPAAVIHGIRDADVVDHPVPQIGPDDVLVEVSHCGICGSDLHYLLEWGPLHKDTIEGHEWSGTVAAVGEKVDRWRVGDHVIGGGSDGCGECEYCLAHRPSLCIGRGRVGVDPHQGAFARYKLCSTERLMEVPPGLSLKHAALTEPLAVALHGITRGGGARPATRWLVTGAGPIGYLSVAALRAEGVDDIVVSEPHARRRELCERLGAQAITPDELPPVPRFPMDTVDDAFDVVLECSGKGVAIQQGLGMVKRGGTLVLVGAGMDKPPLDPNRVLLNEIVVTGANCYDHDGFPRAVELLASGRLPLDLLVEPEDYGLDQLVEAAVKLGEGELARKVMIVPRTGGTR